MPAAKNIFIFGDSITYGEWDSSGGWANRIRNYFDTPELPLPKNYVVTYNLGIPSDTSTGVASRLTQETQARIIPNPEVKNYQFIIAIGTNDSAWDKKTKQHKVNKEQFKANLEDITLQARVFSADVIFVGLLPYVENVITETAKRFNWIESYENRFVEEYNEILKQHCNDQNLEFIDLYERFKSENKTSLFDDGIHPNSKGHALIFDLIVQRLNQKG